MYSSCNPHCDVHEVSCDVVGICFASASYDVRSLDVRCVPTLLVCHANARSDSYTHYHVELTNVVGFVGACKSVDVLVVHAVCVCKSGSFATAGERLSVSLSVDVGTMFEGCTVSECAHIVG